MQFYTRIGPFGHLYMRAASASFSNRSAVVAPRKEKDLIHHSGLVCVLHDLLDHSPTDNMQ